MAETFRSARLVYRAIEDNDEDIHFILSLIQESEGRIKNSKSLSTPANKKAAQQVTEKLGESFLSVLICLPVSANNNKNEAASQVLKPIGRIGLWPIEEKNRHHRNTNFGIHLLK